MRRMGFMTLLSFLVFCGCGHAGRAEAKKEGDSNDKSVKVKAEKEAGKVKEKKSGDWTPDLSDKEKDTVFAIVVDTLEWCTNRRKELFSYAKYELTPKLKKRTHSFVTLKINGRLRGCVGSLPPRPANPLYKSVHENAINAAMRDTRFHPPYGPGPVSPKELDKLEIHISLLSPVANIKSADEFEIGKHGMILTKKGRRSVYLPEVATDQKWTKEQTLSHLSQKAGLKRDAWKEGATFQVFSSVVLSRGTDDKE